MKIIYFIILSLTLAVLCCSSEHGSKKSVETNDSLESELTMLKNQAFCDCFYKSTKIANDQISPPDGTSYIQLSTLVEQYAKDPKLNQIIDKWVEKEYLSYSENNQLYLMRCLDFYNSVELNTYIDSVRKIEAKKSRMDSNN
ncbi:hypothetical protein JGH11_18475 [Dysgonomonas sp. Marseille-P4677]|uniref:hypothetical protein n=1 Tax=Dysgonomonas sp. Marseille-P4677 TaxID=2364790 RepID=UPI00191312FC|nr:hypothetical protein [Dysgonomonas sp. Marseille-P4677]MBK5722860.1 hypothetical protein [Dysgonomonas sp. Marseille-P4677]